MNAIQEELCFDTPGRESYMKRNWNEMSEVEAKRSEIRMKAEMAAKISLSF